MRPAWSAFGSVFLTRKVFQTCYKAKIINQNLNQVSRAFYSKLEMPNCLAHETSPYLLQHAHQPVDWYPWGKEALEKAKTENKLIFLSIGYSTCHWCHVMARESFDDPHIADIMNNGFVCIKIDREERPDIDQQFMQFVVSTTGYGGWPLSVFCTPDGKPFFGGTYFPPVPKMGSIAFPVLCNMIFKRWQENSQILSDLAEKIQSELLEKTSASHVDITEIDGLTIDSFGIASRIYQELLKIHDKEFGGFENAPKFPQPSQVDFLLAYHAFTKSRSKLVLPEDLKTLPFEKAKFLASLKGFSNLSECASIDSLVELVTKRIEKCIKVSESSLSMAINTLDHIVSGGIHDFIQGGFHRYSVDKYYHVSHFEKMLYDQGQLLGVLANAYKLTKKSDYRKSILGIKNFLIATFIYEHSASEIGFYSAIDADSIPKQPSMKKEPSSDGNFLNHEFFKEGAYYTWTFEEFQEALKDFSSLDVVAFVYDVHCEGNIQVSSDPFGEFSGQNILIRKHSHQEIFRQFPDTFIGKTSQKNEQILDIILEEAQQKLLRERKTRPAPHLDKKILAAWNGYTISGLVKGFQALQDHTLKDLAIQCGNFIAHQMTFKSKDGLLLLTRSYKTSIEGFSLDYASCIDAFIRLYESTFDEKWIKISLELQVTLDALFWDHQHGGYFTVAAGNDTYTISNERTSVRGQYLRLKEEVDGAEPCTASLSLRNLIFFSNVTGSPHYAEKASILVKSLIKNLSLAPASLCQLVADMPFLDKAFQRVITYSSLAIINPFR